MDWDYLQTLGMLGVGTLLILVIADRLDGRGWQRFTKRTPVIRLIGQWAAFMGLFIIAQFLLRKVWDLVCIC